MVTQKDKTLQLRDGRQLAYAEYGDPNGSPVMLFHGNPSSRLSWGLIPGSPFRPRLRLIAPDRPGFGRSDFQPGRQLLDWPDDVCELADTPKTCSTASRRPRMIGQHCHDSVLEALWQNSGMNL
jgi:hypothetical protein